ncbi:hypothetical protein SH528x_003525 [Novipirellula sp. SH528]|uniref:hypothetical protein n=1 Tax=Novipirellula sp. SH528 TaxID=3454466 RepID=UPI003F9FFF95
MVSDLLSLKLAIYFVAPALVVGVSAYVVGAVVASLAEFLFDQDVSQDYAIAMTAAPLAAGTIAGSVGFYLFANIWMPFALGIVAFTAIGMITFTALLANHSPRNDAELPTAAELLRGFKLTMILTVSLVVIALLIMRAAARPAVP